jgi:hypothetical protein
MHVACALQHGPVAVGGGGLYPCRSLLESSSASTASTPSAAAPELAAVADLHADPTASCPSPPPLGLDRAGGSSLSPDAAPFHPGCCSGGRSKTRRWGDKDDEEEDDDHPTSYLDAVRRPVRPASVSQPPAETRPGWSHSTTVVVRLGPEGRRRRRSRPRPQLVHDLLARQVEGRVPARQRLGCRGRVSAPNSDGWWEILHRQEVRPAAVSAERQLPPAQKKIPAELHGRCFNCLSYSHRVATCRLPRRCLRCRGFGHIARRCLWPRRPAKTSTLVGGNP